MSPTLAIHRYSVFVFALIPLFAVWGFWQDYFALPFNTIVLPAHVHGIAMFIWVFLLIAQGSLIRFNRRKIHRQLGKLSYLLVPIIVLSTLSLAHYQLNKRGINQVSVHVLSLQLSLLLQFLLAYCAAMLYRHRSDKHARWMVCTVVSFIDPIFARIIGFYFIADAQWLWLIQPITFTLANGFLLLLILWDWRAQRRYDVFLPMLIAVIALQVPVLILDEFSFWYDFSNWYRQLPLS